MAHRSWSLLAGLLLVGAVGARAADEIPAGNYKVTLLGANQQLTFWLVKLEAKDGQWTGAVIATRERIPKAAINRVTVKNNTLRLELTVQGDKFSFEGKLPPDGKKILGSLTLDRLHPAQMELTTLKSLAPFDVAKETISSSKASGPELFDATLTLLRQAAAHNVKPDEVRSWVSKTLKAAEPYGHRWQLDLTTRIAETLAGQKPYTAEAVQYANAAERLLGPGDKPAEKRRVLEVKVKALREAGKEDEAKTAEAELEKIPLITITKFPGRKGKGDEVVTVELFTGAECPPCVAADIAFDHLAKTYPTKDVVLLQYHVHIPGPDPLTNANTEERQRYYEVESTPSVFFNGKAGAEGGGPKAAAGSKYEAYIDIINPLLEKTAKAAVTVSAVQKGTKIEITGTVDKLEKPGDNMRLRFALVEKSVKYQGRNRLDTHHYVVRDLPGGVKGFALKEKTAKQTATVDLEALRKKLTAYLEGYEKERPFSNKNRPLELKKLRVVALVQNDQTKEILQAAQVEVKGGE